MKSLLSREVLVVLAFIMGWCVVVGIIAYPLADKSPLRMLLMVLMSLSAMIFGVVRASPTVRFHYHKIRYRFFGPIYQVRAGGTFRTVTSQNDSTLLNVGLQTAQKVFSTASAESRLTNQIVMAGANARTIRLDLRQEFGKEENYDLEDPLPDVDAPVSRWVEVELWGYEANSTRVTKLVETEIVPFFDNLRDAMEAEAKGRNFWLKITLPSRNPFLQFYLKDVPDAEVSKFQLEFTQDMSGDIARVAIQKEGFSISAFTPRPFTKLVRTYLSTPALANSDGN